MKNRNSGNHITDVTPGSLTKEGRSLRRGIEYQQVRNRPSTQNKTFKSSVRLSRAVEISTNKQNWCKSFNHVQISFAPIQHTFVKGLIRRSCSANRESALPPTYTFYLGPHRSRLPPQSETRHPKQTIKNKILDL